MEKRLNRRDFLRLAATAGLGMAALAGCAPKVVEKVVEVTKVVKEVVKETIIVAGTPQVVEKEVTKIVEKEVAPKEQVVVRFITNDIAWREHRYRQILPDFAYEYPHIRIEYTHTTADWEILLTTWAAGGTMPDVFYSRTQKTSSRARLGWIKSLQPYLDADPGKDELLDDLWPIQKPQCMYKGEYYIIPENISSIAFRFRPEFFYEAGLEYPKEPWSLDEWWEVMRALHKEEGGKVVRWGFDPGWMLTASGFSWMFLIAGFIDTENNKCIIDQPENVEVLNKLQDLKFKEGVIPRTEDIPEGVNLFASDMMASNLAGVWEVPSTREQLGPDKHWDIAWLPWNPVDPEKNIGICYGAGYALGVDAKDPEAAWTLCRFLSRPEMQTVFIVEDMWALPGRKSVTKAWADYILTHGSQEPEHVWVWPDLLETGRTVPITAAEKELEDMYPGLIGPVLTTGEKRAEEVLPEMQKEIQKILDKYAD